MPDKALINQRDMERNKYKLACLKNSGKLTAMGPVAQGQEPSPARQRLLTTMWKDFAMAEMAHIAYMLASGVSPGEGSPMDAWLTALRTTLEGHGDEPDPEAEAQDAAAAAEHAASLRMARFAVQDATAQILPRVTALTTKSGNLADISQAGLTILLTELEAVRTLISLTFRPATLKHVALVPEGEVQATVTGYTTTQQGWLTALATAQGLLADKVIDPAGGPGQVPIVPQQVPQQVPVQEAPAPAPVPARKRQAPKMPAADISFSGNTRDYLLFKQTFLEVVTEDAGPYAQFQYLVGALPEHVKEQVSCYSQDANNLWEQLDKIYEVPMVQVEAAMVDIGKVVTNPALSEQAMMKRLAVVYAGVVEHLQTAGCAVELKSDTFTSRLTSMLPPSEVNEFAKRVHQGSVLGTSQYERLNHFLAARAEEIRIAERWTGSAIGASSSHLLNFGLNAAAKPEAAEQSTNAGSALAEGGLPPPVAGRHYPDERRPPKCLNCGGAHNMHTDGCKEPILKCERCKNWGHKTKDCKARDGRGRDRDRRTNHTDRRRDRDRNRNRDRSASRSRSRSPRSRSAPGRATNAGGYRAQSCRRCATAKDRDTDCTACGRRGHCLEHCSKFVMASVDGKATLAKAAEACPHCLAAGHAVADCRAFARKDDKEKQCGIDGCKKKHHPLLHGTSDPYVTRSCNASAAAPRAAEPSLVLPGAFRKLGAAPHKPITFSNFAVSQEITPARQQELDEMHAFAVSPEEPPPHVLMVMMSVRVKYGTRAEVTTITLFADTGSTCTIVTHSLARRLNLYGRPVVVYMRTVNGERKLETFLYILELLDVKGKRCPVVALGMDEITSDVEAIEMGGVKHLFSAEVCKRWPQLSERPVGRVDCLLGSDYAGFHPVKTLETVDHLVMAESTLSKNMVAVGTHPDIQVPAACWNNDVLALRAVRLSHHVRTGPAPVTAPYRVFSQYQVADSAEMAACSPVRPPCSPSPAPDQSPANAPAPQQPPSQLQSFFARVQATLNSNITEAEFLAAEDLGCEAPRRCSRCRGCQDCSFRGLRVSEREEAELELIKQGVRFDHERKEFQVEFPWLQDPALLDDNFFQAKKIAGAWERKYQERGLTEVANQTFQGMVDMGMVRRIPKEELNAWSGPVHYVAVQGVESGSVSTPLRLVTNTSLRGKNGLSVNDIVAKGPDLLQDPFNIWMRFRAYEEAVLSDISKAYHRLRTGLVELHTRRILWRFSPDQEWEVFGLLCLSFGDRPAAALLETVLAMCAELFGDIDLEAARRVVADRFVDDLHTGGSRAQVDRFVGEQREDGSFSGTIPAIFEAGGLTLKAVVRSHEPDGDRLAKLGGSLMGHGISTEADLMWVNIAFNFTKKKGRAPGGPDISHANCRAELAAITFTRRLALAAVSGLYDPYGYIAPITVQLRAATRVLFEPELNLGWDTPLPDYLQDWWREKLVMMMSVTRVTVPRGIRPPGVEKVIVMVFWDASKQAFATVIYLVWLHPDGNFVYLCCAKSKLAPSGMLSVPRLELLAAQLASRLGKRVVKALTNEEMKVEACLWAGDSETVLAAITKAGNYFSDWFSNRIIEIKENVGEVAALTQTEQWWHVPGVLNPADRPSRLDSVMEDVSPESPWMCGPEYLRSPRPDWPFNRNYSDRRTEPEFPSEELNKKGIRQLVDSATVLVSDLPGPVQDRAEDLLTAELGPPYALNGDMVAGDGPATPQGDSFGWAPQLSHSQQVQVVMANCLDNEADCSKTHLACAQLSHFSCSATEPLQDQVAQYFQHGFRTNSWDKLVRTTARLLLWISDCSKISARARAVRFWLLQAMPATFTAYKAGRLAALSLSEDEGMLRVSGRAGAGLEAAFEQSSLPVIMSETRVAFLIMLYSHERDHAGRDITYHHSRTLAWVVGGRRLAGRIAASCIRCKFLQRRLEGQKMAPLPEVLQTPAPPWTYIAMDYAGWFNCTRGRVTRANTGTVKVWALLIGCLSTKALSILLVPGYGTEDLMVALQTHIEDRGMPRWVHTDRGSQLVKAGKQVNAVDEPQWDLAKLAELGRNATTWTACPAGGQWRNGQMESAVKRLKHGLSAVFRNQTMSIMELQLAFRRISSWVNSRPIYAHAKPGGGEGSEYLQAITPNHLLLGRSSPEAFHPEWDLLAGPHARLNYVHDLTLAWWRQWAVQQLPELVPTPRWRAEHRAVTPGDIVLVSYDSKVAGNSRLARVLLQELSGDGLVRTVVARYSLPPPAASGAKSKSVSQLALNKAKYIRLPVQRLAVILPAELQDPVPEISAGEVAQALQAVGPPDPHAPAPVSAALPTAVPVPASCLPDQTRLDPPPPPLRAATKKKPVNPRLPDPACDRARTRSAARLQHHTITQCSLLWRLRFRESALLSHALARAHMDAELEHGVSLLPHMQSWLQKNQ